MHGIGDVYWKYVTSYPLGVAIANFMVGVPIDESKNVVGGFLQLLHPFALLGGNVSPTMYCSRITISYDTYNW